MSYVVAVTSSFCRGWEGNSVNVHKLENNETVVSYVKRCIIGCDDLDDIDQHYLTQFTFNVGNDTVDFECDDECISYYKINDLTDLLSD